MKTRLEMIEEYDFNSCDLNDDDIIGTEEDEPKKWGVWSIYTNEFLETFDTKEEAEEAMQEYIENDYNENGYTAKAYEVKEV